MPPLDEGSLLFMPTFIPATSFTEVKRVMAWQDRVFAGFPEVRSAVGKLGRAETATDPAPVQMIETIITLKPESEWRRGVTRPGLVRDLTEALQLAPGSVPGFLQPIQGRVLMLSTGLRAELGIKLFGDRPDELQRWALEAEKIVRSVPGASGVVASRTQGKPYLEIEPDREALARYRFRSQDVMDAVEIGLGGKEAGVIFEERRRVPIQLRWQRSERDDIVRLRDTLITGPAGKVIPLGQLAAIRRVDGPDEIASENGRLRAFVQANVDHQTRDLASFVLEVKARLARDLQPRLPKGVTLEYSGDYENQLHARDTLLFIVPGSLLIIFVLLHRVYRRAADAAHVLLAIPFALSGGVFLQFALGLPFSVAVWVGYLALFGTAIQTAIVMVVYLDEAVERTSRQRGPSFNAADLIRAVKDGARLRLRPKVMTVATIIASLLPIFWSARTGADIIRPIAAPIIGGMLSSLLHVLIVTPVIFAWLRARDLPTGASATSGRAFAAAHL
jgi:Cu(I)/Ag(I) efflux system membrane protein CusA/SilA